MKLMPQSATSKRSTRWRHLTITVPLICAAFGNASALASDTWTGAFDDSWADQRNWSTGSLPVQNDDVIMLGPGNTTNTTDGDVWHLNTLQFPTGAPSFLIHIDSLMLISGAGGIINDSDV